MSSLRLQSHLTELIPLLIPAVPTGVGVDRKRPAGETSGGRTAYKRSVGRNAVYEKVCPAAAQYLIYDARGQAAGIASNQKSNSFHIPQAFHHRSLGKSIARPGPACLPDVSLPTDRQCDRLQTS